MKYALHMYIYSTNHITQVFYAFLVMQEFHSKLIDLSVEFSDVHVL